MKRFITIVLTIAIIPISLAQPSNKLFYKTAIFDSLFAQLDDELENQAEYIYLKKNKIDSLKRLLNYQKDEHKYQILKTLVTEYETFAFDSAYLYSTLAIDVAEKIGNKTLITEANLQLCLTLVSSGMFHAAIKALNELDIDRNNKELLIEYNLLKSRAYFDLSAHYKFKEYSDQYDSIATALIDELIPITDPETPEGLRIRSFSFSKANKVLDAIEVHKKLMTIHKDDYHQVAIQASSLALLYRKIGNHQEGMRLMILASIADIKNCTMENIALTELASMLFNYQEVDKASTYIQRAMKDASFYGARQRQNQISTILPIIEAQKLTLIEEQKESLKEISVGITILFLFSITLLVVVWVQFRKLSTAKRKITGSLKHVQELNQELRTANRAKEEYLGYFFSMTTDLVDRLTKMKNNVSRRLSQKRYEDIQFLLNELNPNKEKELLFVNFDRIFLRIFPRFIQKYNALFEEKHQVKLKDGQLLNKDLRIFALIRLGINDNEAIAKTLNYSVNTVYTYKTRIKNKSIIPNDQFEEEIMKISAID